MAIRARRVKKASCRIGIIALMKRRIAHFRQQGRRKTAENYGCALARFMRFRKGEDVLLEALTVNMMKDFQEYMTREGLKMNTVSLYNRILRAVYNYALDEGILSEDRRPFRKVFTGHEKTRKRAVRKETVRRLISLNLNMSSSLDFARDLFLFSIYTQGMAFVDIAHLTKNQVQDGHIRYARHKTGRQLDIVLQPCAKAIIDKWATPDDDSPYLFPILYDAQKKSYRQYSSALRLHNKRLARLSALLGQEVRLSSYVARHTWASLAKWNGVAVSVISEAMGHASTATTAIYLASFDTGVIAAANRQILASLLDWPLQMNQCSWNKNRHHDGRSKMKKDFFRT